MMSSFNPNNRHLSAQEWQTIAHDAIDKADNSHTVVIGGILGLIAAAAASPLTGGLVFLFFLHKAWKDTQAADHNDRAVLTHGCVAHVLSGEDLRDFVAQVGKAEVVRQIQWAIDSGYRTSSAALDYLESANSPAALPAAIDETAAMTPAVSPNQHEPIPAPETIEIPVEEVPCLQPPNTADSSPSTVETEVEVPLVNSSIADAAPQPLALPQRIPLINLAQQLGDHLKPLIISAMPRAGKGMLVAYAWRYAKLAHPGLEVWVIDPKAHPSESGYWAGVDRIWRKPIADASVNDEAIAYEIEQFVEAWRQSSARPKLLIFDEQVLVKARLPRWYGVYVPSLMLTESSSGETDKRILWAITQSPLVGDMGLSGGNRSSFLFVAIARPHTSAHLESAKKSGFVRTVPAVGDYAASPVQALAYYSARQAWVALPRYQALAPIDESLLPHTGKSEQEIARARLEGLLNIQPATIENDTAILFPASETVPDETERPETTQSPEFESLQFSAETLQKRFPETTETAFFACVLDGYGNGYSPSDIIKLSLKLGKRYQEAKAACVYVVRKYGNAALFRHFEKWIEE